jgi:hypothetical protein
MTRLMLVFALYFCTSLTAHAAKPRINYYSPPKTYSYTTLNNNDQERCQAEANYMAANNITGHVWGCIGSFEGVGYGHSPNCNTCTPSSNMTLTGDASAQGKNGMWYRVRSWR